MTGELPGVEVEPVIGDLDLVTIDNLLLEDTVPVAQAITPGGVVQGRKTVEETGGKSAETSVTEGSIVFLLDDVFDTESEIRQTGCDVQSVSLVLTANGEIVNFGLC